MLVSFVVVPTAGLGEIAGATGAGFGGVLLLLDCCSNEKPAVVPGFRDTGVFGSNLTFVVVGGLAACRLAAGGLATRGFIGSTLAVVTVVTVLAARA